MKVNYYEALNFGRVTLLAADWSVRPPHCIGFHQLQQQQSIPQESCSTADSSRREITSRLSACCWRGASTPPSPTLYLHPLWHRFPLLHRRLPLLLSELSPLFYPPHLHCLHSSTVSSTQVVSTSQLVCQPPRTPSPRYSAQTKRTLCVRRLQCQLFQVCVYIFYTIKLPSKVYNFLAACRSVSFASAASVKSCSTVHGV